MIGFKPLVQEETDLLTESEPLLQEMQGQISTKNLLGATKSSLLVPVRDKMFLQFNPQWFEPDFYVICVDPRAVQFCSRILPLNRRFRDVSLRFRGLCQGLRNPAGGGYKLSSFNFILCISVFHVIIRTFYYCILMGESDTIAQWFRLRPPSWFESQAHHLCFFHLQSNFVLYLSLR